jgi:hypothetical protein
MEAIGGREGNRGKKYGVKLSAEERGRLAALSGRHQRQAKA